MSTQLNATIIGAGRIGIGLAADLLHRSGYQITVIGRGETIAELQRCGHATVRLTDGTVTEDTTVPMTALFHSDAAATAAIAASDVVCIAVGADNIPAIADQLAAGLGAASRPVNVIAFENREDAADVLRTELTARLGEDANRHGMTGTVIARAVAQRVIDDGVLVVGDRPEEFYVDAAALTEPKPRIRGMVEVDNFRAYYRRKLYRYSAGHATAAYLGKIKGYRYLHAAVMDPEIAVAVLNAMDEGRRGLKARYGAEVAGTHDELLDILARFRNAALGDTVARVGRDPRRKLRRSERLIGAARLAAKADVLPVYLTAAAAAALESDPDIASSPECMRNCIADITGLSTKHVVTRLIARAWADLAAETSTEVPLLSLPEMSVTA